MTAIRVTAITIHYESAEPEPENTRCENEGRISYQQQESVEGRQSPSQTVYIKSGTTAVVQPPNQTPA